MPRYRDTLAVLRPALDSASKHLVRAAVLAPLFFLPAERRVAIERRLRGREQWGKLRRADLVVVSFGKSGRTWLRVMLSRFYGALHGLPERLLIGFDNLHLREPRVPRVFFTHDNYTRDHTGEGGGKGAYADRRVVLLVRHPADVAVSQYHQWRYRMRPRKKAINDYPEHGREVGILDFVAAHPAGLPKVVGFMNEWARERHRLPRLLIVRYEDMREDAARELARIAAFAGTPGTPDAIAEAVRFASFENMRQLETRGVFWPAGSRMRAGDRSNPASFKVRRGKVDGWRDYFTADEAARIAAEVDATLLPGFGYTTAEAGAEAGAGAAAPAAAA